MLLQIIASLLLAASAPVSLETGDVLAGHYGLCFPALGCDWVGQGHVVGGDGTKKQTINGPVWLHCCSYFAKPGLILITTSGLDASRPGSEVMVSTDGMKITDTWLKHLGLWSLTNIAPMRSGDFLVGESSPWVLSRLVRFDSSGNVVAVYTLPSEPFLHGAQLIELLADQCTVAWVPQYEKAQKDERLRRTLRAFDICKNAPAPDLFVMPDDVVAGHVIRQLPDGGFLTVTTAHSRRFDASGTQIAVYPIHAGQGFALTPDGRGCWYGGDPNGIEIRRVDLAAPDVVLARATRDPGGIGYGLTVVGVVGEWRASLQPAPPSRRRVVRR